MGMGTKRVWRILVGRMVDFAVRNYIISFATQLNALQPLLQIATPQGRNSLTLADSVGS